MKMKFVIALCICSVISLSMLAQDEEEPKQGFDKSRLFIGGNFGLSFGDFTLVNISPQLGYRFNNIVAAGAGVNFIYSSTKYRYFQPPYRENFGVAGLNIFGRVYPIQYAFLQLQPEANYIWGKRKYDDGIGNQTLSGKVVPALLAGAGAAIPAASGAFIIMAQYDILQNSMSPYGEKVFLSIGFNFGL